MRKKRGEVYIFLAAYCRQDITLDELITAIIFYRALFAYEDKAEVVKVTSEHYSMFQSEKLDKGKNHEEKIRR